MLIARTEEVIKSIIPLSKKRYYELRYPGISYRQADNIEKGNSKPRKTTLEYVSKEAKGKLEKFVSDYIGDIRFEVFERYMIKYVRNSKFVEELSYWDKISLKSDEDFIDFIKDSEKNKWIFSGLLRDDITKLEINNSSQDRLLKLYDKCVLRLILFLLASLEQETLMEADPFKIEKCSIIYKTMLPQVDGLKIKHPQGLFLECLVKKAEDIKSFDHYIEIICQSSDDSVYNFGRQFDRWKRWFEISGNKKANIMGEKQINIIIDSLIEYMKDKYPKIPKNEINRARIYLLNLYFWAITLHKLFCLYLDENTFDSIECLVNEFGNYKYFAKYHNNLIDAEEMVASLLKV